jgi:hypothetical protein
LVEGAITLRCTDLEHFSMLIPWIETCIDARLPDVGNYEVLRAPVMVAGQDWMFVVFPGCLVGESLLILPVLR